MANQDVTESATNAHAVGEGAGAAAGAVAGGLAGHGVAAAMDPVVEDAYWRDNYRTRPLAKANSRLGWSDAKDAVRDGWHRVERAMPVYADGEGR